MLDSGLNDELDECIKSCLDSYSMCQQALNYCLQHGGRYVESSHLRLLTDCSEACVMAASFMLRNSDMYMSACSVSAEVCDGLAESCDRFEGDEMMSACASSCRNCADLCDRVSQQILAA